MDKWTLKVGDMIVVDGVKTGVITKLSGKSVQYYTAHTSGPGAYFKEKKKTIYDSIDLGRCEHFLLNKSTKWRRRRLH